MSMARLEALNNNFEIAHNYCVAILKHSPHLDEPVLVRDLNSFHILNSLIENYRSIR